MKNMLLISAFLLITSLCKSQAPASTVTGNFIGQSVWDNSVMTIEVKPNHKYVLKTYTPGKAAKVKTKWPFREQNKGTWSVEGERLVLTEKSGKITVLEKYQDIWYLVDKNRPVLKSYSYQAKFYQNKDQKVFWEELRAAGC